MLLLGNLGKPQWVYTALDHLSSKTGVPKLSPSMYPFSISIDEHVPLNMSARSILSRKGPIVDFPGVGQNIFAGGNKCGKIWFSPLETKKRPFYQKILYDEKTSNFKILGRPWSPLLTPMPLKLLMAKRLGKITKIYLPIRIKWFLKIIFTDIYFNILTFEPDMKFIEPKHTLSAQHGLIITVTERFVTALVVGPQDYRHLFADTS